ncbi:MAG: carbohydrate kinase family protein [Actinomycetota bacterium]
MYDVITVGSNTLDVFAYTDRSESICIKTIDGEECYISYPSGSKLLINELDFDTGGGGTNTAVSLTRMGLSVGYIGKIGGDNSAEKVLEELKKEGIDFLGSHSADPQLKTGYSIILDSIEKNRTILTFKGVNDRLQFRELDTSKLKAKWFYLCSMVGKSFDTLKKLAAYAGDRNMDVLFNPSNYLAEKGDRFLSEILTRTKILILNQEETAHLVGKGEPIDQLKKLKSLGPRIAVITHGSEPVHCLDAANSYYILYPQDIKVVEVTGAGDSFASSFLAAYIKGEDTQNCLKIALANSQSVLQYKGAKRKLLSFQEAKSCISKNPPRVDKIDSGV